MKLAGNSSFALGKAMEMFYSENVHSFLVMPRSGRKGSNPGGILSTQEVATILRLSHPTLLRLLKEKKIPEPQVQGNVRQWSGADLQHALLVVGALRESGELRMRARQ